MPEASEVKVNPQQKTVSDRYRDSLQKDGQKFEGIDVADKKPVIDDGNKDTTNNTQNASVTENKDTVADNKDAAKLSDDDFRKRIKAELGLDLDEAKSKLSKKELTEEDKKKAAQDAQKAIMDEYLSGEGNTIESYNSVQAEISKPDMDLVRARFFKENEAELEGMTDAEKESEFNDEYHLDEGKFTPKSIKIGEKKIAKEAKAIRDELLNPIKNAETSLKTKNTAKDKTTQWERSVDEWVKTEGDSLKKLSYKDEKHGEAETVVPDEVFNSVVEKVRDMRKFATYLQNPDGTTNKKKLAEILIKAEMFDANNKLVAEAAYGKGAKDAKAHLPSAPDFSNTGKQDNGAVEVTDLQHKANQHNQQQRTKRR